MAVWWFYYDAADNRQAKEDLMAAVTTDYTYDVSDPGLYLSQGNRLMQSRAYDSVSLDPIETRWYVYDLVGRTTRVIQAIAGEEDANGQWYRATDLYYDTSGRLWVSRLQRYQLVEVGDPPQVEIDLDTRQFLAAMEYRYDAGRQRYMVRPRDAETLAPPQDGSGDYDLDIGAWHDYSGAAIYGDYAVEAAWDGEHQTVTAANVTETLAHEPGMVQYDRAAAAGEEQLFLHGNLVGTTEWITDAQSAIVHRAVYTAFGEPIFPSPSQGEGQGEGTIPTRYGYVGAWGYQGNPLSTGQALDGPGGLCDPAGPEAHCDPVALLGWLHVGERYYDPASGRFMQRDPMGIRGGLNVYVYVVNLPVVLIDPHGLWTPFDNVYVARITIFVTGGNTGAGRFIDKVGGQIARDHSRGRFLARGVITCGGLRLPKGISMPGGPGTTSIWTKVPGISLGRGQAIGRVFLPFTLLEGTFAAGDIGRGIMAWAYDLELDGTGVPFY